MHKMIQLYRTWYNQSRVTHAVHRWYDSGIAYPLKATLICSSVVPRTTSKICYVKENDPIIKHITKYLNVIVNETTLYTHCEESISPFSHQKMQIKLHECHKCPYQRIDETSLARYLPSVGHKYFYQRIAAILLANIFA